MIQTLHKHPSLRLSHILRSAAFGVVATAAFLSTSTSVLAGAADYTALNTQLGGTKTDNKIDDANTAALVAAVQAVVAANPKLKPGNVIGEALKNAGSPAPDIGTQLATYVKNSFAATKIQVATDAVKTAGAGATLNVSKIPKFAAGLSLAEGDAIALATNTKASKEGSGAVLGGYSSTLLGDVLKQTFANTALANKAINANAQSIAKFIAAEVTSSVAFTTNVAGADANSKLADKIIVGTVAGKPTEAGVIVDEALKINDPAKPGVFLLYGKITGLSKTIGTVADIEQIQKVGQQIAKRIGINGGIKLASASTIAKNLAAAIASKPIAATGANSLLNRADEAGELAAYMIAAVSTSAEFLLEAGGKVKNADKTVIAILKSVIAGAKGVKLGKAGASPTKAELATYLTNLATYVSGSVGLTVANLPAGNAKTAIINALTKVGFAKSIAGASNETLVAAAITNGLDGEPAGQNAGKYENGFAAVNGFGAGLTDPETNYRNF